jgi:hypothetical protein
MSAMVTVYQRLASAWAVFFGKYGDVTHQAAARGQSRQALYREARQVVQAVASEKPEAKVAELEQRVTELTAQLQERDERLHSAVQITPKLQRQYASTAQALGVSLAVARELLAVFLQTKTPSVAKLGRWTKEAGVKSGQVLKLLDELVRPQVEQVAADEIFLAKNLR